MILEAKEKIIKNLQVLPNYFPIGGNFVTEAYLPEKARDSYLIHLFEVEPTPGPRAFREHRHSWFELVVFKRGYGVYQTSKKSYRIQEGDVFAFSSNEIHSITEISGDPQMRLMNLHFDPRYYLDTPYDGISQMNFAFLSGHGDQFENRLPRENPATAQIRQLLLNIEEEFRQKGPEYAWAIRSELSQILLLLVRELSYGGPRLPDGSAQHLEAIRDAVDYIRVHLTEELTLEDIARAARLSPNYFSTLFRQVNGQALWDYVTARRIERAMRLLELDDGQTVLDIATQCGFNNTANFNKMFKKHTGRTPSEYRRKGVSVLY